MRIPAQKVFAWHYVGYGVVGFDPSTGGYDDPSYGITAESAADYTAQAIAGWGVKIEGQFHFRERESGQNVSIIDRP